MRLAWTALLLAGTVSAQASSSTFFLAGGETGSGGTAASATWKLTGSLGSGVVPARSGSSTYALTGGFPATLDAPVIGRPWLAGVRPLFAPIKGGTALTLHGTELHLGTGAAVRIGGQNATVTSRTRDAIQATLPVQPRPGWTRVDVTAGGATSSLPRGIGVLPLLDMPRPAEPGIPFEITYHGTQGDAVLWMLSLGNGPFPIPIPPFHHAFELNLLFLFILTVTPVTAPSGKVALPIPGVLWGRPLHFQCLAVSTAPGYAPGSFTNVQTL